MEETGNRATASGKIWKLVYKAHAEQRKGGRAHAVRYKWQASVPWRVKAGAAYKKYTIVQTERDDNANTHKTIHVII